jgi:hypothetical protein
MLEEQARGLHSSRRETFFNRLVSFLKMENFLNNVKMIDKDMTTNINLIIFRELAQSIRSLSNKSMENSY